MCDKVQLSVTREYAVWNRTTLIISSEPTITTFGEICAAGPTVGCGVGRY